MKNIAVDMGKHSTKAFDGKKKINIESKLNTTHLEYNEVLEDSRIFEVDSKKYIIGKQAEERNFDTTKATESSRLAMYVAISEFNPTVPVNVFVGCPLTVYKNPTLRKEYVEYLSEKKDLNITVNGELKRIQINSIIAFPESYGLAVRHSEVFKNKTIGVLDLGGLNLNGCVYADGSPQWGHIATENLGVNIFKENLRTNLNVKYGTSIHEMQINDILENGVLKKEDSKEYIDKQIEEYINKILLAVKKKEWDIDTLRIGLTGGGSKQFKKYFEKALDREILMSQDGEFDNVIGFYQIGVNYIG